MTQQGTLIMANFMTDQMEQDLKRQELVNQGKLSVREANEQAAEWEKVCYWEKKMELGIVEIYLKL